MKSPDRKNESRRRIRLIAALALAGICFSPQGRAANNLVDFQFNEGPPSLKVTTKAGNLTGSLGFVKNPANDPVSTSDSPSGAAGDNAVALNGVGFLVADDSVNPLLAFQNQEFTIETWVKVDPNSTAVFQGILGYGGAYKLGLRDSQVLFTLFGIVDIESGIFVTAGEWHHLAVAWKPGVGVTFYYDGAATEVAEVRAVPVPSNNLINIGAERLDGPLWGSLDRLRIHKAFLTSEQLDSVAATRKALLASTVVAYDFNEAAFPFQSATPPARPAISSEDYLSTASRPVFSQDTPSGAGNDYSLQFKPGTYVLAPDDGNIIAFDPVSPNFTMEAWVKPAVLPAGQQRGVLFGYNGPGGAFTLSITFDRKLFITTLGIADVPSKASVPDDGGWHHVAVVHESGKELRFYVDGILGDTVAYTGNMLIDVRTDTTLTIGVEPGLWNQYLGLMDRVRLTSGVLAPDQLDYLAVPGVTPGAPTIEVGSFVGVSWPTIPAGYKLQSTLNVEDSASWTPVTNSPTAMGGKYFLYLPATGAKTFYRLVKP